MIMVNAPQGISSSPVGLDLGKKRTRRREVAIGVEKSRYVEILALLSLG
jgi:hypothetical protein